MYALHWPHATRMATTNLCEEAGRFLQRNCSKKLASTARSQIHDHRCILVQPNAIFCAFVGHPLPSELWHSSGNE